MALYFVMVMAFWIVLLLIQNFKLNFRCAYFRQKLINRNVDVSHVDSMTIIDIIKS